MFILTNGKVTLQPFKVTYEREIKKVVKEGGFDEEAREYIKPIVETEVKNESCYFDELATASAFAESVGGNVEDLTPSQDIIDELPTLTFESLDDVRAFVQDGIRPIPRVTLDTLAEVIADIIGGVINVG